MSEEINLNSNKSAETVIEKKKSKYFYDFINLFNLQTKLPK